MAERMWLASWIMVGLALGCFTLGLISLPVSLLWVQQWSTELFKLQHPQTVLATTSPSVLQTQNTYHAFLGLGLMAALLSLISLVLGMGGCLAWGNLPDQPAKPVARSPRISHPIELLRCDWI